jgi:ribosome-binding protein aMBF1 (putative translation factor)
MLGELIRRDRERWGLTIEQAARWFHTTPSRLRKIEADEEWPSWETFDRIERIFGRPR